MLIVSGCKINLGLAVVEKRADGYHTIESVFFPVPWNDVIEIIPAEQNELIAYGIQIPGNATDNFCVKAYQLLAKDFKLPSLKWILLKMIPTGAGLGGGSANAANALKLISQCCQLKLTQQQLLHYAAQIGSDCPFFVENTPQFVTGRGEFLEKMNISLAGYKIILINPGIHINTASAFKKLAEQELYSTAGIVKEAIQKPIQHWKEHLKNDFEQAIFPEFPLIENIKNSLYSYGALYASMSGSGSTVYGIFKDSHQVSEILQMYSAYTTYTTSRLM